MIDAHVHAFPSLAEQANRLADRLPAPAKVMGSALLPSLRRAASLARRGVRAIEAYLPRRELRLIEGAAWLYSSLPQPLQGPVETSASLGLLPAALVAGSLERLLSSMDSCGVDRAMVIGSPPVTDNDWLLEQGTGPAANRLVPVATLPALDEDAREQGWLDAFDGLARRGARGFKIHPNLDGLPPSHRAYRALFQVARERKRFVILHTGCFHAAMYRTAGDANPEAFAPLFSDYPEVPVCLAHMNRDRPEVAWSLMRAHPGLFADTSWQPGDSIARAVRAVGADRLMLGSDWPILHGSVQADAVQVLKKATADAEFEQISSRTALHFLGEA